MRDFLDAILAVIGSASLTDVELDTIDLPLPPTLSKEMYEQLKAVLQSRDEISTQGKRLKFYFIAYGVDLSSASAVHTPNSNIFIGEAL